MEAHVSGIPESSILQRVEENQPSQEKDLRKSSQRSKECSNCLLAVKPTPGD